MTTKLCKTCAQKLNVNITFFVISKSECMTEEFVMLTRNSVEYDRSVN